MKEIRDKIFKQKERLFKKLFEHSKLIYVILDKNGNVVDINAQLCRILGCKKEKIIGKNWFANFIPQKDITRIKKVFNGIVRGDIRVYRIYENPVINKKGKEILILWHNEVIKDENKDIIGTISIGYNIEYLRKTSQEVSKSETIAENIVENVRDGIVMIDGDGKVVFMNKSAEKMLGYTESELKGEEFHRFVTTIDEYKLYKKNIGKFKESGKGNAINKIVELKAKRKDGTLFYVELSITGLKINDKWFAIGIMHDVTSRKIQESILKFHNNISNIINNENNVDNLIKNSMIEIKRFVSGDMIAFLFKNKELGVERHLAIGIDKKLLRLLEKKVFLLEFPIASSFGYKTDNGSVYINDIEQLCEKKADCIDIINSFKKYNIKSFAIVPLIDRFGKYGAIYIFYKQPNILDKRILEVTEDAVVKIYNGINRIYSYNIIKQQKQKYDDIINSTDYGVINFIKQKKNEYIIIFVNKAIEDIFGYKNDELIGKSFFSLFTENSLREKKDILNMFLKTDSAVPIMRNRTQIEGIRKNGEIFPVEISLSFYTQENQNIYTCMLKDITFEILWEKEQIKRSRIDSLALIAGGIAHDFNNLLVEILSNLSVAKEITNKKDKIYEMLEDAENGAIKAKKLANQLLTFSKGGDKPLKKVIELKKFLKNVVGFTVRGKNINIHFNFSDNLSNIYADETYISQVIDNIIINALQVISENGNIWLSAENVYLDKDNKYMLKPGKYVKISIKDDGPGIPQKDISKIFDPYFTTKENGSGLGLAICYSIIKRHKGYIEVESEFGKGATFNIYLPATDKKVSQAYHREREDKKEVKKSLKILIMDDEPVVRKTIERILILMGHKVVLTKDGKEAIEVYKKAKKAGEPFDIVILDLTVCGGMGGEITAKKLIEYDADAKIIATSGYSLNMNKYKKFGFQTFLRKPFTVDEVRKTIENIILRKHNS